MVPRSLQGHVTRGTVGHRAGHGPLGVTAGAAADRTLQALKLGIPNRRGFGAPVLPHHGAIKGWSWHVRVNWIFCGGLAMAIHGSYDGLKCP